MKFLRSFAKAIFTTCAMLVVATSCKQQQDTMPKNGSQQEQKTVRLYLQAEPYSLDPRQAGNRFSQVALRELFEGLMRIDTQGRPASAVAKSYEISEDKLTYRFHLRPAQWSNGMPVTAYDFEYSWLSNLYPDAPTAYSYAFYCIKNARAAHMGEMKIDQVGIKAEDEHTLVVTLEHPAPYFIELTSNPLYSPVCKAVVEKNSDWKNCQGKDFICNGPFVLDEWKHRSELVLLKNDRYWDSEAVSVHRLTFPIIEDPLTALNMYETGQLDWVGDPFGALPLEAIPRLKERKNLEMRNIASVSWLEVNVKNPLLASAKIRKALAMAINRQDLADHLLQGGERPAYSLLPETLTFMDQPFFKDNDVEQAKALFNEGIAECNLALNKPASIILSHSSDPRDKSISEAIQQQWQKAFGINVILSPSDWNAHLNCVASGNFEVASLTWYSFYHDAIYNLEFLKYAVGWNGTHWEHPHYIELLNQSDATADEVLRDKLLSQAEQFLMNEMPVIPICHNTSKFCKNPKIYGESLSPIGMFELKKVDVDAGIILVNK
ncbi:MAG: peptide ABC transporter substrate-binding protein [Chlamydiales bacterium]|nr:peptide ABC transporter substrate-binding protein [Chlamydiales bacterium]